GFRFGGAVLGHFRILAEKRQVELLRLRAVRPRLGWGGRARFLRRGRSVNGSAFIGWWGHGFLELGGRVEPSSPVVRGAPATPDPLGLASSIPAGLPASG